MEVAWCMLAIAAPLALWNLISPRSAWWMLVSWRYKEPGGHEPSDAGYAASRVGAAIALIALAVAAVLFSEAADVMESQQQEQQYQQCLDENDDGEGLLSAEDWCENLSPTPQEP